MNTILVIKQHVETIQSFQISIHKKNRLGIFFLNLTTADNLRLFRAQTCFNWLTQNTEHWIELLHPHYLVGTIDINYMKIGKILSSLICYNEAHIFFKTVIQELEVRHLLIKNSSNELLEIKTLSLQKREKQGPYYM